MFEDFIGPLLQEGVSDLVVAPGQPVEVRALGEWTQSEAIVSPDLYRYLMDALKFRENPTNYDGALIVGNYRLRLNMAIGRDGAQAVFRVLPSNIPAPATLRLPKKLIDITQTYSDGLILISGSTGSGKSTTLASLIHAWISSHTGRVVTLENPVEFRIRGTRPLQVFQREVPIDCPDFASGVVHAMRQAPNLIMVGEIRDAETALAAIDAAVTGHLVFGTLHTGRAPQALQSLFKLVPEGRLGSATMAVSMALRAVCCQRLEKASNAKRRFALHELLVNSHVVAAAIRDNRLQSLEGEMSANSGIHQTYEMSIRQAQSEGLIGVAQAEQLKKSLN